ncbi:MAG: flavodoxin family protein [Thomasclavelia ramosa]
MKTIIMYYTLGGTSKKEAERIASENENVVICEVQQKKKYNIFTAFILGCPKAMKRQVVEIKDVQYDLSDFDRIIFVAPIWAGFPVPAFNAMVNLLPAGKEVEIFMCSGGGEAPKSEEGTKKMIQDKNCKLIAYHNIKASK